VKKTKIYQVAISEANRIKSETTMTEAGSLKHFLWGSEKSEQSIVIKFGRVFEKMIQEQISTTPKFELGLNGVQNIIGQTKKKDVDLLFIDKISKTIFYRELKANIDLDTEKLPATTDKIAIIENHLINTYPGFSINSGILCMTVYSKCELSNRLDRKVKAYGDASVNVEFAKDIFATLELDISKEEYETFGLEVGTILRS
tara:strand:+ start:58 stop:660 length:603 start_codon:yes stop_codon:yes gene_type:complete